jgi:hypothetical protein
MLLRVQFFSLQVVQALICFLTFQKEEKFLKKAVHVFGNILIIIIIFTAATIHSKTVIAERGIKTLKERYNVQEKKSELLEKTVENKN